MWASTDKQDPVIITNKSVGQLQRQNDSAVTLLAVSSAAASAAAASSAAASSAGVTPAGN